MKKIILSCIALASLSAARAQFTYGPEVGANLSNYRISFPGLLVPTTVPIPGAHIGVVGDYRINDHMAIEPAAYYSLNGIKYTEDIFIVSASFTAHLNTIRVPVNFQYTFGEPGGNRFFAGIGPFVGLNLGGSAKVTANIPGFLGSAALKFDSSGKISSGNDSSDYIRKFDFGFGVNVGYQLTSGLFLRANYAMGLLNLSPVVSSETSSIKSANYAISVGYLVGYSKKKKGKATTKSAGK